MAHASQERYSALVDAKLRATLVTRDNTIFNNRYEGSPKAGKVKIPVRDTEVAVKAYDKANGVDAAQGNYSRGPRRQGPASGRCPCRGGRFEGRPGGHAAAGRLRPEDRSGAPCLIC